MITDQINTNTTQIRNVKRATMPRVGEGIGE
jgi:hypothetical protein